MKREHLLTYLRVAGYHEDRARYTRLYIENKISKAKADEAFNQGRAMKVAGVPCNCTDCERIAYTKRVDDEIHGGRDRRVAPLPRGHSRGH